MPHSSYQPSYNINVFACIEYSITAFSSKCLFGRWVPLLLSSTQWPYLLIAILRDSQDEFRVRIYCQITSFTFTIHQLLNYTAITNRCLKSSLTSYFTGSQTLPGWDILVSTILLGYSSKMCSQLRFIWHVSLPQLTLDQHELLAAAPINILWISMTLGSLISFTGVRQIYPIRNGLLRGSKTMLTLHVLSTWRRCVPQTRPTVSYGLT